MLCFSGFKSLHSSYLWIQRVVKVAKPVKPSTSCISIGQYQILVHEKKVNIGHHWIQYFTHWVDRHWCSRGHQGSPPPRLQPVGARRANVEQSGRRNNAGLHVIHPEVGPEVWESRRLSASPFDSFTVKRRNSLQFDPQRRKAAKTS